jgi:hypothetical protein
LWKSTNVVDGAAAAALATGTTAAVNADTRMAAARA